MVGCGPNRPSAMPPVSVSLGRGISAVHLIVTRDMGDCDPPAAHTLEPDPAHLLTAESWLAPAPRRDPDLEPRAALSSPIEPADLEARVVGVGPQPEQPARSGKRIGAREDPPGGGGSREAF